MKVLLISSSPHNKKSQTFILAKEVLKSCVKKGAKSEIIHLRDLKIDFCRACEVCHKKILCCPIQDDAFRAMKKVLEADGIILASPNYLDQITGSMKALFDRFSHLIHCRRLLNKYVVGVVSSGSGQDRDVLDYIKYYAHICGAQYSGSVSSRAPVTKDMKKAANKLGERLTNDIRMKKIFPEQAKTIEDGRKYFRKIIEMRKDHWSEEYQYWKEKGWL